jgi:hypothetical protein
MQDNVGSALSEFQIAEFQIAFSEFQIVDSGNRNSEIALSNALSNCST